MELPEKYEQIKLAKAPKDFLLACGYKRGFDDCYLVLEREKISFENKLKQLDRLVKQQEEMRDEWTRRRALARPTFWNRIFRSRSVL